jgi:very-short-patch-repair endonuclease
MSWTDRLFAAVLAGGPDTLVSHRAALVVWGMDGVRSAPVEVTVPYSNRPIPQEVIVHRTRRAMSSRDVEGLPVTDPERTLLDVSSLLPPLVVAKALESSIRRNLTTVDSILEEISTKGGRGVRGSKKLKRLLAERQLDTPTGSGSETELIYHLRRGGVREPELQYELFTRVGDRVLPDFYWPALGKAVEVDGLDAHSSAQALESDLARQNSLLEMGIELRRFSARRVRRNPGQVVEEIRRFLES